MNKFLIIGASIAGILGTMDIITTDPLKYGACALLGITAFMTFNELNPQQKQGGKYRETREQTVREKPKDIWEEFGDKVERGYEKNIIKGAGIIEPQEVKTKKEPKFIIEDTNVQKQNKIQNPEEVPKTR